MTLVPRELVPPRRLMDADERERQQPRLLVTMLPGGHVITGVPMTGEERARLRIAKMRIHARLGMPLLTSGSRSKQGMLYPNG